TFTINLLLFFTATISRTGTLTPNQRAKVQESHGKGPSRKISVGAQFRHSLSVLMEKMYAAEPHFIRCIKPNIQKEPNVLETETVLNQLRYNGLMETLRIRRDGFAWRPSFHDFVGRFGIILLMSNVEPNRESCLRILDKVPLTDWYCGKSRLFFKYWHQDQMAQCVLKLNKASIVFQKCYKSIICRRKYRDMLQELKEQKRLQDLQEQRAREEEEHRAREEEEQRAREEEEQRALKRLQEEINHRISTPPVPAPRKRPSNIRPCSMPQPPVPRPRSRILELSPFDNPKVSVGGTSCTSIEGDERETKKMQRRKTLVWFKETQASKVLSDGTFPLWLHGMISRRDTENLLSDKEPGDFLIRISQTRAGYILSYKSLLRILFLSPRDWMVDRGRPSSEW
ncbi:hypothetical protein GDO86_019207, partial [Hymenochirus boettgeri]